MTQNTPKNLIKHPFEVHAAQAVEDLKAMEEGFFTPDIYFTNGPKGAWGALHLRNYIIKMGYQAEIAVDNAPVRGITCIHLKLGRIPEAFLLDIKHFMSVEEIRQKKANYCVQMDDNGQFKKSAETAMWQAFQELNNNNGGRKSRQQPQ